MIVTKTSYLKYDKGLLFKKNKLNYFSDYQALFDNKNKVKKILIQSKGQIII